MTASRLLTAAAIVLGLALLAAAVVYLVEPASSLPGVFPGHEAASSHHHVKHGIAAGAVGVALLVFAWFRTGRRGQPAGAGA